MSTDLGFDNTHSNVSQLTGVANKTSFLGGTREESDWKWLDGSPFEFENWGPGEPSGGSNENCLELGLYQNGTWNDVPCNKSYSLKAAICSLDIRKYIGGLN